MLTIMGQAHRGAGASQGVHGPAGYDVIRIDYVAFNLASTRTGTAVVPLSRSPSVHSPRDASASFNVPHNTAALQLCRFSSPSPCRYDRPAGALPLAVASRFSLMAYRQELRSPKIHLPHGTRTPLCALPALTSPAAPRHVDARAFAEPLDISWISCLVAPAPQAPCPGALPRAAAHTPTRCLLIPRSAF